MIRLREILDEIELRGGDYLGFELNDVFEIIPVSLFSGGRIRLKSDSDNVDQGKTYTLKDLPEELDKIKKMGKVLKEKNDILVVRYEVDTNIGYVVFDTTVEFKIGNGFKTLAFIQGYLHTVPYERQFFTSPNNMLEVTNVESVRASYVVKQSRGKGFGKMLYDAALSNVDALISDQILYKNSFGLWTNHIYRESKFFGGLYRYNKLMYIIPLGKTPPANIAESFSGAWGFIAFGNKVPQRVIDMNDIFAGTSIDDITIIRTSPVLDFDEQVQDLFDNSDSLDEIVVEQDSYYTTIGEQPVLSEVAPWDGWKNPANPVGLFHFTDALVFAREEGDGVYWDLL
jgi:GNAT superfamily N-acetyltransferase